MHPVQAAGAPLVLADSKDRAMVGSVFGLWAAYLPCSLVEKRQAVGPDKGLVPCGSAPAADRAEPPLEVLPPQSCGYSPPAPPDRLPLRGHSAPVPLPGASGRQGPARAGLQSHVPSAGLRLLSGAPAPGAAGPASAD